MTDISSLVRTLDGHIEELAKGALGVFVRTIPEAERWTERQQNVFVEQAKGRFGAMLAIVEQGTSVDEGLVSDLEDVGVTTALAHGSLPQLLTVIRISRDMLIANAIQIAKGKNNLVSTFLERLVPAVDGMIDAISSGYWSAHLDDAQRAAERFGFLVEQSPYGIYEADIDGVIRYANDAFCTLVRREKKGVIEQPLTDVLRVTRSSPTSAQALLGDHDSSGSEVNIDVEGDTLQLNVATLVRREREQPVAYAGVVREEDSQLTFVEQPATEHVSEPIDFQGMVAHIVKLQKATDSLADASGFLEENAERVTPANVRAVATAIGKQGSRMRDLVEAIDQQRRSMQFPDED